MSIQQLCFDSGHGSPAAAFFYMLAVPGLLTLSNVSNTFALDDGSHCGMSVVNQLPRCIKPSRRTRFRLPTLTRPSPFGRSFPKATVTSTASTGSLLSSSKPDGTLPKGRKSLRNN